MRKWLVWEGDLNNNKKQTNPWTTWNELMENKRKHKREDRLNLTLHPALPHYSPICNFYFPGSPLCFSSRCLPPSVPSLLSNGASLISPPVWDIRTDYVPPSFSSLAQPTRRSTGSASCFELGGGDWTKTHLKRTTGTFWVHKPFPLWVCLHACSWL